MLTQKCWHWHVNISVFTLSCVIPSRFISVSDKDRILCHDKNGKHAANKTNIAALNFPPIQIWRRSFSVLPSWFSWPRIKEANERTTRDSVSHFALSDCIMVILETSNRYTLDGRCLVDGKKSQQREIRNKLRSTRYALTERGSYPRCGSVGHQCGKSPFNKRTADFYGSRVCAWKTSPLLFSPFFIVHANISAARVTIFTLRWMSELNCFRWLTFWEKKFFFL